MYSAKRKITKILLQKIDFRKSKLYYNRQENASHSGKSCILKNIYSRSKEKNHNLHESQKFSFSSSRQRIQLETIEMNKKTNSLRFRDQTHQENRQHDS